MKRYDLMVPENFTLGKELGLYFAAQIDEALEKGIRHFHADTKNELTEVIEIMKCIDTFRAIAVWSEDFGPNEMGVTAFSENGSKGFILPINDKIKEPLIQSNRSATKSRYRL